MPQRVSIESKAIPAGSPISKRHSLGYRQNPHPKQLLAFKSGPSGEGHEGNHKLDANGVIAVAQASDRPNLKRGDDFKWEIIRAESDAVVDEKVDQLIIPKMEANTINMYIDASLQALDDLAPPARVERASVRSDVSSSTKHLMSQMFALQTADDSSTGHPLEGKPQFPPTKEQIAEYSVLPFLEQLENDYIAQVPLTSELQLPRDEKMKRLEVSDSSWALWFVDDSLIITVVHAFAQLHDTD